MLKTAGIEVQELVSIDKCKTILSTEDVLDQIALRRHLIKYVLVGSLYPRIVADEIQQLEDIVEMKRMLDTGYHRAMLVVDENPIDIPE